MQWQRKATIMQISAVLPFGDALYRVGQKLMGQLQADPMRRLPMHAQMARWLAELGPGVEGLSFLEVGTGHVPVVPVGFFLTGAARVLTIDLHRRMQPGLLRECLQWIAAHRAEVEQLYSDMVPSQILDERFGILSRLQDSPRRFLKEAGIEYLAPMDATRTGLPPRSIDCHFSVTTLEHIAPEVVGQVLAEAKRLLKAGGLAIHFIDTSDHFWQQDRSISAINFLQYSEEEWRRLAGNRFAYCNRLRASDYLKLFSQLSFQALRWEAPVDREALATLQQGFELDSRFRSYAPEDLCSTALRGMWRIE